MNDEFKWGDWDKILDYLKVNHNSIVVDVGACVGDLTILAARRVKKVIAIEPEPNNIALLYRNIKKNKLHNVCVIKKAAWSSQKKLKLYLNKEDKGGHSVVMKGQKDTIIIQSDTLDNILSKIGIEKIDFLKMNIEGAEIEALKGMVETFPKIKKILIETHTVNGKKMTEKVKQILKANGFTYITQIASRTSSNIGILAEKNYENIES